RFAAVLQPSTTGIAAAADSPASLGVAGERAADPWPTRRHPAGAADRQPVSGIRFETSAADQPRARTNAATQSSHHAPRHPVRAHGSASLPALATNVDPGPPTRSRQPDESRGRAGGTAASL